MSDTPSDDSGGRPARTVAKGPFARKLDLLFRTRRRPVSKHRHTRAVAAAGDRNLPRQTEEYPCSVVAKAVGSTDTYLRGLREGSRDNPGKKLMEEIARFFGVDLAYLAKDDIPVEDLPEYLLDRDDAGELARRVTKLFTTFRAQTVEHVAEAIGFPAEQIRQVCDGSERNPGILLLQALTKFFGISPVYLTETDPEVIAGIDLQLDALASMVTIASMPMAARGQGTSEGMLDVLHRVLREAGVGVDRPVPPSTS